MHTADIDYTSGVQRQLQERQQRQKEYFDNDASREPHTPFTVGQHVRMQVGDTWQPATVIAKHESPRSYIVESPIGQRYRRNRKHLTLDKSRIGQRRDLSAYLPSSEAEPSTVSSAENESPLSPTSYCTDDVADSTAQPVPAEMTRTHTSRKESEPVTTRSGRNVRKPSRYND